MLEDTSEQVSDSLHTAVRVIGETSTGKDFKMIEHQERSKIPKLPSTDRPPDSGTGTFRDLVSVNSLGNTSRSAGGGIDSSSGGHVCFECG